MQQIQKVIDFLEYYGGNYNRLDRALYWKGDITPDRIEFSCFSVASLLIRTVLNITDKAINGLGLEEVYPQLEFVYSGEGFPNLIDLYRDGVYCFNTETSFEDHEFIVVKYQNIYYYIGGYGGINEYVIHKLSYNELYDKLYNMYVKVNYKIYKSFLTNNSPDMKDFFSTNEGKIKSSKLTSMSIYYVSDITSFNISKFEKHFNKVVNMLNKDSYYSDIYIDIADCKCAFC